MIYELEWEDWENVKHSNTEVIEFQCDKDACIDWDTLSNENRYSLKPINKDEDFIGKEIKITPILKDIKTNLQSGWFTGQKRTGKTSSIRGIERELNKLPNFIVVRTEYGHFAHHEPIKMIDQLVQNLINNFSKKAGLTTNKPDLNGSLAPLVNFINDLHEKTESYLFFIIDEFDNIPSDFYKGGEVSTQFWLSLRSLSQMDHAGFLLVGGEDIKYLKEEWGMQININTTYYSDRFKNEHFEYFEQLVTHPTINELKFENSAIQEIYDVSGGNPYFAKMVCRTIQKHACAKHDSFISQMEVKEAVEDLVISDLQLDYFQHFIKDGIKDKTSDIKKHELLRAKYLHGISVLLENNTILTDKMIDEHLKNIMPSPSQWNIPLEFKERNILYNDNNILKFSIPLFEKYLKKRGSLELQMFFRSDEEYKARLAYENINKIKYDEVSELVKKWGIYQDEIITEKTVLEFLEQFKSVDLQRKVYNFICQIKFVKNAMLIALLKSGFDFAVFGITWEKGYRTSVRPDVFVSYLDGPAKSGAWIARKFSEANPIRKENVLELSKIEKISNTDEKKLEKMKVLVLVDDFSGSGDTLITALDKYKEMICHYTDKEIKVVLFSACCLEEARPKIQDKIKDLNLKIEYFPGEVLYEEEKIFSDKSRYFSDPKDREFMRSVFETYGSKLLKNNPLGYNGSEVAIVFEANCPNNSLPILWSNENNWKPLFRRRIN
jgi:hypothetical protein